jgi:hypothetical protein
VVTSGSSLVSTSAAACAADACSNCGKRGGGELLTESANACLAISHLKFQLIAPFYHRRRACDTYCERSTFLSPVVPQPKLVEKIQT